MRAVPYQGRVTTIGRRANLGGQDASAGAESHSRRPGLHNAEFNRAFVLMQFYVYLRRNPNAHRTRTTAVTTFWLGKLNQFQWELHQCGDGEGLHHLIEYRQRFARNVAICDFRLVIFDFFPGASIAGPEQAKSKIKNQKSKIGHCPTRL